MPENSEIIKKTNNNESETVESYIKGGRLIEIENFFRFNQDKRKLPKKSTILEHSFIIVNEDIYLVYNVKIGAGDYGYVKKAINVNTRKEFALKIVAIENENGLEEFKKNEQFLMKNFPDMDYIFSQNVKSERSGFQLDGVLFKHKLTDAQINNGTGMATRRSDASSVKRRIFTLDLDASKILEKEDTKKTINSPKDPCWRRKKTDPASFPLTYKYKGICLMKLFDNFETLRNFSSTTNDLNFVSKLKLLLAIFEKLKVLHDRRIIHNDLNPGNILIQYNKEVDSMFTVEFIDYDLSVILPENEEIVESFSGKGSYALGLNAPEQFSAEKVIVGERLSDEYKHHPLAVCCEQIKKLASEKHTGFSSKYSDIFKLGRTLDASGFVFVDLGELNHEEVVNAKFLSALIKNMTQDNPLDRDPLEKLIKQCTDRLNEATSQNLTNPTKSKKSSAG